MATTCVFVTVSEGVKTLIRTVDVEVNQKHTFDELLDIVLELKDVALESFDERKVTVTMRATLSSPSVEIGKRTATVASRIGAGHFVAFNVAPPPPKPMARPEVAKADQAAARARSSYLLQAAGRALIARPEKHDVNNKLLSASLWFNGLVDSFEASGLAFAKADVCKPDGSGYRFVLALSQLLNHLDGHHLKLEKTNCALPDAEIFRSTFRKAGPGSTNSLPALSTDRIKSAPAPLRQARGDVHQGDRKARVAHRGARRDDRRCEADPNAKACYFLNSFFFAKLMGDDARSYSYRGVQRWTKTNGVDLFAKRFILAPINVGNMHWCLAAVDMHLKTVRYYDSMAGPGWVYLRALLRYLGDEHQDKKGVRFDAAGWTMVATTRNTPQQLNGFDCGVFASYCAHYISLGVRPTFSQADMPHLRRRMMADILAKKIHADKVNVA